MATLAKIFRCIGLGWLLTVLSFPVSANPTDNRFLEAAWNAKLIQDAIDGERPSAPEGLHVTGVGVPHHLVAPDLIARGLLAADAAHFDRIVLLTPDHFRETTTPFGVTTSALDTVFGTVPLDESIAAGLLENTQLFSDVGAAPREHGIHAITPFIANLFPGKPLVAITAQSKSTVNDWEDVIDLLAHLTDTRTLIVQSTDYSHFLPQRLAVLRDQETLNALADGSAAALALLRQPAHLDSLAAQYIQTRLQNQVFGAQPVVLANRNAHAGSGDGDALTTSYVVTAYLPDPRDGHRLLYPDHDVVYFAGDTFLGRGITPMLQSELAIEQLQHRVAAITGGAPLILNLEGTVLSEAPVGRNNAQHLMLADQALPVLARLGTTAVSAANNHAYDFGAVGAAQSEALLTNAGFSVLKHGQFADIGGLRVLPLTMRRGYFADQPAVDKSADILDLCQQPADPPVIAFLHWGGDYDNTMRAEEKEAVRALSQCGISAVLGAHSHVASNKVQALYGLAMPTVVSLGNFIFDQDHPGISGAVAEIRVFAQGTIAVRLIPLGNLYADIWTAP